MHNSSELAPDIDEIITRFILFDRRYFRLQIFHLEMPENTGARAGRNKVPHDQILF